MVWPGRLLNSEVEKLGLLLDAITLSTQRGITCSGTLGHSPLQPASRCGLLALPVLQRPLLTLLLALALVHRPGLQRRQLPGLIPVSLLLPVKVQGTLYVFRKLYRLHHSVSNRPCVRDAGNTRQNSHTPQ